MNGKEFITVARATIKEFGKDDVGDMAASLTYYSFFSIFPMLLLAITLIGVFVKPQDATAFVFDNVTKVAPGSVSLLHDAITRAFENRDSAGWIALVGVVILVFSASGAFGALDKAVNRAWNAERVPSFVGGKIASFVMILVIAALLVVSVIVSTVLSNTQSVTNSFTGGGVPGSDVFWSVVNTAASLGVVFLAFLVMYRFLPRCDVNLRDVWPAALIAAIAWTILKEAFAFYLSSPLAKYDSMYGTLGATVALLTWIYLSSIIILTGAEFSSETARVRRLRPKPIAEQMSRESPWLPM